MTVADLRPLLSTDSTSPPNWRPTCPPRHRARRRRLGFQTSRKTTVVLRQPLRSCAAHGVPRRVTPVDRPVDTDRCGVIEAAMDVATNDGLTVKFRVERDVLAEAVTWVARGLPVRPSVPVLAGHPHAGHRRRHRLSLSGVRLRGLGPGRVRRRHHRTRCRAGQRPAARRHLPQPARQAGRPGAGRLAGLADLWFGALQPADHAGRGLPDLPVDARAATGTVPSDAVLARGRPGRHRRRPRRHAAGAHRRPHRDRGRHDLAARPPTASGSRTASSPGTRRPPTPRSPPWCRPRCWPTPPSRSAPAATVVIALGAGSARRRGHHRLRGRLRRAAYDGPPPGCSTASSPRSAACSPASTSPPQRSTRPALIESVKRVALVAERNTPVRWPSATAC